MVTFKTRKRDKQVFPINNPTPKSATEPTFMNLNKGKVFVVRQGGKPVFVDQKSKQEVINRLQSTKIIFKKFDRPEFLKPFDEKTELAQSIPVKKAGTIDKAPIVARNNPRDKPGNPNGSNSGSGNPNGQGFKRTRSLLVTLVGLSIALSLLRNFRFASGSNQTIKGKGAFKVTKLKGGFVRTETKQIGKQKPIRFRFIQPNPKTKIRLGFVEAGKPDPTLPKIIFIMIINFLKYKIQLPFVYDYD